MELEGRGLDERIRRMDQEARVVSERLTRIEEERNSAVSVRNSLALFLTEARYIDCDSSANWWNWLRKIVQLPTAPRNNSVFRFSEAKLLPP